MKTVHRLLVISLVWMSTACAFAQVSPAHESHSGNKATEFLWEQSDKAFHAGDYERAIQCHKGIVAIDPHDVQSFGVAAWLMWSLGKKEDAMAHIARGLKENADDWEMWDEAGQHYQLQAGVRDPNPTLLHKAKDAFVRAVKLLPADADKNEAMMLRRRLAHAAEKADDLELAIMTWKKLVEDYPDDVVNKNNLARAEKKLSEKSRSKIQTAAVYGASAMGLLVFVGAGTISKKIAAA